MKKATLVSLFLTCFAMTPVVAHAASPAAMSSHDSSSRATKRVEVLGFDICVAPDEVTDGKPSAKDDDCDLKLESLDSPMPALGVAKKLMFAVLPDVLDGTFEPATQASPGSKPGSGKAAKSQDAKTSSGGKDAAGR